MVFFNPHHDNELILLTDYFSPLLLIRLIHTDRYQDRERLTQHAFTVASAGFRIEVGLGQ